MFYFNVCYNFVYDVILALAKNYDKTLPGLKTHSCLVFPPNVPSHPLLLSWKPFLQHIPVSPHHEHFPCLLLQFIQQSLPAFLRLRAVTHCKNSSLYIHLLNDLKLLFHLSKMKKWASKLILPSFLSVLQTSCACKPFFPFCLHMPFEFLKHIFPFANVVSILLIPRSLHACAHSAFFKLVDPGGHFIPAFAKMYLVLADEMMAKMNKK